MILPMFSYHLRAQGFSHTNIGLLKSAYGIFQLIFGPIIGSWSDVNGRQSILSLIMIICGTAYLLLGALSSFYAILMIRCVLGVFKHSQTLCRTATADIVPVNKQASVYGLINAVTAFSFMLGPFISGHVMELENGFKVLSVGVFLIYILNSTIVMLFAGNTKSPSPKRTQNNEPIPQNITLVFRELYNVEWNRFWLLFTIKFLIALSGILFFQNLELYLTEHFEITPRYVGYTMSFYGLIAGLSNVFVGTIKTIFFVNKSPLKSLSYIFGVLSLTLYGLCMVDSYPLFVIGLMPLATSQALTRTFMTEMVVESSDESVRGSVMGASGSCVAVARVVVPTLGGLMSSWGGISVPFLVSAMISLSALLLTVIFSFHEHQKLH